VIPSAQELALIDRWQRDFPLVERPFAAAGAPLGLDETETVDTFRQLQAAGVISRIGAVIAPRTVGASTLAAMQVPPERFEAVAALINAEPGVNHNYERTHAFNLWFVVTGPDSDAVKATLDRISKATALAVIDLPLVSAYHIDLGFSLSGERRRDDEARGAAAAGAPDVLDRTLLAAIEEGLPFVARPYSDVAGRIGIAESDLIGRLQRLLASGVVSRLGCVVRHRALGYTANAMAVWDLPDERIDAIAAAFARDPRVSLCYRRPRRLPDWPFNLFCMVHARTRAEAHIVIDALNRSAATQDYAQHVLFSTRCFKQRGASYFHGTGGLH